MATLYVDGDNGNDADSGATEPLAKATIQAAVNAASDGDTIYVQQNGSTVYDEDISASAKGLYLEGYGTTVGDRVRPTVTGGFTFALGFSDRSGALMNFKLQGTGRGGTVAGSLQVTDDTSDGSFLVYNCSFETPSGTTRPCVDIQDHTYLTMVNCFVKRTAGTGTRVKAENGATLVGCRILASGDVATDGVTNLVLCSLFGKVINAYLVVLTNTTGATGVSTGTGLDLSGATGRIPVVILSSWSHWQTGFATGALKGLFSRNGAYGNTNSGTGSIIYFNDAIVSQDPRYTDQANYLATLLPGSPWLSQSFPIGDYDNNEGAFIDIGAVQNKGTVIVTED